MSEINKLNKSTLVETRSIPSRKALGGVGTLLSENFNDTDFRAVFNDFGTRYDELERIIRSDAMIRALLLAVKSPIKSSKWNIAYPDDFEVTDTEEFILKYLNQVIFNDLDFYGKKLNEILIFADHGWSIFEKIFIRRNTLELGDYISVNLPTRLQNTISTFLFEDKGNPDRVTHLNQQFSNGNRTVDVNIPIEKLVIFTNEQLGNDLSGKSLIMNCYRSFVEKDLILRMEMIAIERHSIGTPLITVPENSNEEENNNLATSLGFMAREKGAIWIDEKYNLEILKGEINVDGINKAKQSRDTSMALSFLAQFLLLGQNGNGGSFSLGKDQSDFFLTLPESLVINIKNKFNELIIELVDIQVGKQTVYPKLESSDINNKATLEMANTLKVLTDIGLLTPDDQLQKFTRKLYDLPIKTNENDNDVEKDDFKDKKNIEDTKEDIKDTKLSDTIKLQEQDFFFKEKVYINNVTENEDFIQATYENKYLPSVEQIEFKIKDILNKGYNSAKTELRGGTKYISQTGNSSLKNVMKSQVKDQFSKLKRIFNSDRLINPLINGSLNIAENANKDMRNTRLQDTTNSEIKSLINGYISNVNAVVFNEERKVLENLESNFGNGLNLGVIEGQVNSFKINRNILKLSVISHPRAVFRAEILRGAENDGINLFKMVIPKNVKLEPSGKTISLLFFILTQFQWEEEVEDNQNAGGVVGGLGLHHNSLDYYLPISDDELKDAEELSREKRKKINLDKLKNSI